MFVVIFLCVSILEITVLITLNKKIQVKLSAFRVQWMSELRPSSGASGTSDRLVRTRGLKKQDTANEEKVSSKGILFQANYVLVTFIFTKIDSRYFRPQNSSYEL